MVSMHISLDKVCTILWTLAALLGTSFGTALADDGWGTFDAGAAPWRYYGGFEFKGAKGSAQAIPNVGVDGSGCLRISGDFAQGGFYVGAQCQLRPFLPATGVRFMVRSSQIDRVMVRATDFTGQTHQLHAAFPADGQWHELTIQPLNQGERYGHFGGSINDGSWHSPMRSLFIGFDKKAILSGAVAAELDLDQVRVIAEPAAASSDNAAKPVEVSITLQRQTKVDDGLSARGGDKGKVIPTEKKGRECWSTDLKAECSALYFNVDDSRAHGDVERLTMQITYLDEGLEPIVVQVADAAGKAVEAGQLPRRNSQRWITGKIDVTRPTLANGINDEDVRLLIQKSDMAVAQVSFIIQRKDR